MGMHLNEVLVNIMTALVGLGGAYIALYAKKATEKIKLEALMLEDDTKKSNLDNALKRLDDVTLKTVLKLEQTVAKDLRAAISEGKVDKTVIKDLSTKAYCEIIDTLEPEALKIIRDTLGDAKIYIFNMIEAKVLQTKMELGEKK